MKSLNNSIKYIIPPQNIFAEQITIGILLSDAIVTNYIMHMIDLHFFSLEKHQILYIYTKHVYKKDSKINLTKLINLLWNKSILRSLGGIDYIMYIIQRSQSMFTFCNQYTYAIFFIKILQHYYIKRLFIQYSFYILQLSYLKKINVELIYKKAIAYLIKLESITYLKKKKDIKQDITNFLRNIYKSSENEKSTHIFSGFHELDKITNGFKLGDLVIIAGRPSMGKTSFVINLTNHFIFNLNLKVHIFSLEMSKNQILNKIISLKSSIALHNIQTKTMETYQWEHLQKTCQLLMQKALQIDENNHTSIEYIITKSKNTIKRGTVIIIDYLQLISYTYKPLKNRSQEVSHITRELKLLAKSINSPIITLSQLNRSVESRPNKRPLLSDLRESGCVSYYNLPNIKRNQYFHAIYFIEAIHCIYTYYQRTISDAPKFHKNRAQYIYSLDAYKDFSIHLTHNHMLLDYKEWLKADQIKKQDFNTLKYDFYANNKIILELNIIKKIKLLSRMNVYDITLHEYSNFISGKQVVHNSIEQDADLVIMLYKEDEKLQNKVTDIVIAKHRNGPIGAFQLLFYAETCKFSTISKTAY